MNYVVSLFMAFSATFTAFAATEFSDQIKKLTNEIVKSKEGASLLETAQQLRLKKGLGVMTRSDFKNLISGALLGRSQEDLSKDTDKIREDLILYIKDLIQTNEADELEIMAREDAIRTNEHGKKRIRKAESSNSKAGAAVKLEEGADFEGSENPQPADSAGVPENSDQENQESSFVNRSTGSKSSKNKGSDGSNTKKSTRTRKANPKYGSDCIGCY